MAFSALRPLRLGGERSGLDRKDTATAFTLFGLALIAGDGLLALAGLVLTAGIFAAVGYGLL